VMYWPKRKKVFVVGCNKTGTTSMRAALESLGYRVGDQVKSEMLLEDWAQRDFRSLIKHCRSADAFQDVPFSMNYTCEAMDQAFPGSKFVLTVRDSPEAWFESTTRFMTNFIGQNCLPTADDLKNSTYSKHQVGWVWRAYQLMFEIDENTLFDKELFIQAYEAHNDRVRNYFRYRPDDLLELRLTDPNAMELLSGFLGVDHVGKEMPHLNRSTG
jgi:hypothetical protein